MMLRTSPGSACRLVTALLMVSLATAAIITQSGEECLRKGGVCVPAVHCPQDKEESGVQCPNQADGGKSVCCYSTAQYDGVPCGSVGGECVPSNACGRAPRQENASGCSSDKPVCCIFVRK